MFSWVINERESQVIMARKDYFTIRSVRNVKQADRSVHSSSDIDSFKVVDERKVLSGDRSDNRPVCLLHITCLLVPFTLLPI